ncbi:MAG: DUF523 domain-containing protein [Gammaproteobacteria bacterium]|nr:MAG: DUF523 domain-containing protein [Gammaproteobacteria bacterium]
MRVSRYSSRSRLASSFSRWCRRSTSSCTLPSVRPASSPNMAGSFGSSSCRYQRCRARLSARQGYSSSHMSGTTASHPASRIPGSRRRSSPAHQPAVCPSQARAATSRGSSHSNSSLCSSRRKGRLWPKRKDSSSIPIQPIIAGTQMQASKQRRPRVGVSACLLGDTVRYDGGHKRNETVLALGEELELIPLCPEFTIGLGIPRPPLAVFRQPDGPRVRQLEDRRVDVTDDLREFGHMTAWKELDGYILKARSPSCAADDAPLLDEAGQAVGTTAGLFALAIREEDADVPMISEEALQDSERREAFLAAVRARAGRDRSLARLLQTPDD